MRYFWKLSGSFQTVRGYWRCLHRRSACYGHPGTKSKSQREETHGEHGTIERKRYRGVAGGSIHHLHAGEVARPVGYRCRSDGVLAGRPRGLVGLRFNSQHQPAHDHRPSRRRCEVQDGEGNNCTRRELDLLEQGVIERDLAQSDDLISP